MAASFRPDFRSERLIYRAPEDTPLDKSFFLSLLSDRSIAENSSRHLIKPPSCADADSFLRHLGDCPLGVLICLPCSSSFPSTPTPIGFVKLGSTSPPHHRNANMSIQICRDEQGKGYGSEAVKWALEWCFMVAGLHRVGIGCFAFNEGARKLYERLGFVVEGRTREVAWKNGEWHDIIEMGMLEGEWRGIYLVERQQQ